MFKFKKTLALVLSFVMVLSLGFSPLATFAEEFDSSTQAEVVENNVESVENLDQLDPSEEAINQDDETAPSENQPVVTEAPDSSVEPEPSVEIVETENPTSSPELSEEPTETPSDLPEESQVPDQTPLPSKEVQESPEVSLEPSETPSPSPSPEPSLSPALQEDIQENNDFVLNELADGEYEISSYKGYESNLLIPSEISGKKIVSIADRAFADNELLEVVTIENGIKNIGEYVFYNNPSLNKIVLPGSLKNIDENAFEEIEIKGKGDGKHPVFHLDFNTRAFGIILLKNYRYKLNKEFEASVKYEYSNLAEKAYANVGHTLNLRIPDNDFGGTKPYQYLSKISLNDRVVKIIPWNPSREINYKFANSGMYKIQTWVRDNNQYVLSSIVPVTYEIRGQNVDALSNITTVESPFVALGQTIKFYANPSGGKAPYTYAFYIYKDGVNVHKQFYQDNLEFIYTPTSIGKYSAISFVKDANSKIVTARSSEVVVNRAQNLSASINITSSNHGINNPINVYVNAINGSPNYLYAFYVAKDGGFIYRGGYSASNTFQYIPRQPGNYIITAFVKDSQNKSTSVSSNPVSIIASNDLNPSVILSKINPSVGETLVAFANASGGKAPYTYAYYVQQNGSFIKKTSYSNSSRFEFKIPSAGKYIVTLFVKDSNGKTKTINSKVVNVLATATSELVLSNSVNKLAANIGDTITVNSFAKGGLAPYQYAHYLSLNGTFIAKTPYSSASSYSFKVSQSGKYQFTSFVRDASGKAISKQAQTITVSSPVTQNLSLNAVLDKASIDSGDSINILANAIGGKAPYQYSVYISHNNNFIHKTAYSSNNRFTYRANQVGKHSVIVFVKDANGNFSSFNGLSFNVRSSATKPLAVTSAVSSNALNVGENVTVFAYPRGGSLPYSFAYYVHDGKTFVHKTSYANNTSFNFTVNNSGIYTVTIFVKDGSGRTITTSTQPIRFNAQAQVPNYRALLIGQSDYPGDYEDLWASANDVSLLAGKLSSKAPYGHMPVTQKVNIGARETLNLINSSFTNTNDNSVSIFYYSGHGLNNGSLILHDKSVISPSQLANALNKLNGKVIVIIDACYSGGLISKSLDSKSMAKSDENYKNFSNNFISAFRDINTFSKSGELISSKFHVITSSAKNELSYASEKYSFLTLGIIGASDKNNDGFISMYEAYLGGAYFANRATAGKQHVKAYPSQDNIPLFKN